jgi:hypothetical protein
MMLKWGAWLAANIALLLLTPTLALIYLDQELTAARKANPNMSTDGDSLGIPVLVSPF